MNLSIRSGQGPSKKQPVKTSQEAVEAAPKTDSADSADSQPATLDTVETGSAQGKFGRKLRKGLLSAASTGMATMSAIVANTGFPSYHAAPRPPPP